MVCKKKKLKKKVHGCKNWKQTTGRGNATRAILVICQATRLWCFVILPTNCRNGRAGSACSCHHKLLCSHGARSVKLQTRLVKPCAMGTRLYINLDTKLAIINIIAHFFIRRKNKRFVHCNYFKNANFWRLVAPLLGGDRHMGPRTFWYKIERSTTLILKKFRNKTYFWQRSALKWVYFAVFVHRNISKMPIFGGS